MAISSIHIANGNSGYLFHNDRSSPTNNSIFTDEKNEFFNGSKKALKIYREELQKRSQKYTDRTNQKLQKKTTTHLSAIVNLNQHHTLEDMKPLIEYIETSLDTKVFQVAIHRDEGHIEDGKDIKNYHAHIEFLGVDSQGYSVKQNRFKIDENNDFIFETKIIKNKEVKQKVKDRDRIDKTFLSQLQTQTADILKMERGQKNSKAKRLDTYEFKKHKEKEEKTLKPILAKQKDLKEQMAELKEQKAGRQEYAKIEELNRSLKEQIKAKELTAEELKSELSWHKSVTKYKIEHLEEKKREQEAIIEAQQKEIEQPPKIKDEDIEILKEQNRSKTQLIIAQEKELLAYKRNIEQLKNQPTVENENPINQQLKEEVEELKAKVYHPSLTYGNGRKATYLDSSSHYQKLHEKAREEIKQQKATIDALEAEITTYKEDIERLEANIKELKAELRTYRGKDRQSKRAEVNQLEQKRRDMEKVALERFNDVAHIYGEESFCSLEDACSIMTRYTENIQKNLMEALTTNTISQAKNISEQVEVSYMPSPLSMEEVAENIRREQKEEEEKPKTDPILRPYSSPFRM